jgi:CelD/BcsL family acetyltransferase involved in cellulose biosynthesis
MNLEVINNLKRLQDLEEAWSSLTASTPYPVLHHSWVLSVAEAFQDVATLQILAVWDGPRLVAVAPLSTLRQGPATEFRSLAYWIGEPDAFVFLDQAALDFLVDAIFQRGIAFRFSHLKLDGAELQALRTRRKRGLLLERAGCGHAVELPTTAAAFEDMLSKSSSTLLRRKMNRAAKFGRVEFSTETLDAENSDAFLEELVRIEGSGWKGRSGTSLSQNVQLKRFFAIYLNRMAPSGDLRGDRLKIDGVAIAIRLGLRSHGRLYELKIGFDEAFQACSPGLVLTHETLKASIREGLTLHEFLGVGEQWQRHWPLRRQEDVTVRYYPMTFTGAYSLSRDVLNEGLKWLRRLVLSRRH